MFQHLAIFFTTLSQTEPHGSKCDLVLKPIIINIFFFYCNIDIFVWNIHFSALLYIELH